MQQLRFRTFPAPVVLFLALLLAVALAPGLEAGEKKAKRGEMKAKPKAIHKVMAEYPAGARAERTEGVVVAALSIQSDGTVSAVDIQEGDEVFHKVTIAALEQWKFEPLKKATQFVVTVNFRLDGDEDGEESEGSETAR